MIILFKEKRCEAARTVNNYKACDSITEEIVTLKSQQRHLMAELKLFERKEKKSKWYNEKKELGKAKQSSTSESESLPPSGSISVHLLNSSSETASYSDDHSLKEHSEEPLSPLSRCSTIVLSSDSDLAPSPKCQCAHPPQKRFLV